MGLNSPKFWFSGRTWFWVVLFVGIVLRLGVALALGDKVEVLPGIFDQVSYHNLAIRVLDGHGFSFDQEWWPITKANAPTAHWSFLYTFYLIGVYALFGVHPLAGRLIQAALVGLLLPWLTARISERMFLGRTLTFRKFSIPLSLLAAAWAAFYPYFLYYAGALMTESFYMVGILWAVDCAMRISALPAESERQGSLKLYAELGLALGITILLRQLLLIFAPFLFLWLWWARSRRGSGAKWLKRWRQALRPVLVGGLVSAGILAVMILPFTAYNYVRFNRFVLLNTNSGYAFFWANHPIYGNTFVPILTPEMGTYQDLIPVELRSLDEAALDQALMQRGIGFVVADPVRYIRLTLSRIPAYFIFWPSPDSSLPSNLTRGASLGLALPFMLFGIFLWGRDVWRKRLPLEPGVLILLFVVVYTAIHLLSWALVRYRLPVDAALLPFAAYAVARLLNMLKLSSTA